MTRPSPQAHRPDIQGLRAVAVLLVALDHAGVSGLAGGFVGVDVFFVISGFLITGLLLAGAARQGRVDFLDFYAKRAKRILPAATVVLLATVLASAALLDRVRARDVATDAVWSSGFLANVHFQRIGTDYFAKDLPPSPMQHFWSLSVEEQFYVFWPAVLALLLLAGARRRGRGPLVAAVLLGSAASFAWCVHQTGQDPTSAYFSIATRAWELGVGALLALGLPALRRLPANVHGVLGWAGALGIGLAATTFDSGTAFPGSAAALPVLATAAVLAGGLGPAPWGVGRLLSRQPLRWIGDVSYSFYLWHWPVLVVAAGAVSTPLDLAQRLGLLGLALGLSAGTYYAVEQPFRRARPVRRTLLAWPVAVASVLIASLLVVPLLTQAPKQDQRTVALRAAAAQQAVISTTDPALATVQAAVRVAAIPGPVPTDTRPRLTDLRQDLPAPAVEGGDEGCIAERGEDRNRVCATGDLTARRTVVLMGDSHAGMWLPGLERIGNEQHWRVIYLSKGSCTASQIALTDQARPFALECARWRDWADAQVADIHPDLLVLGGFHPRNHDEIEDPGRAQADLYDTYQAGWERTVARLAPIAGRVAVLGDTPTLSKDPGRCLSTRGAELGDCTVSVPRATQLGNAATARAARASGARFVDVVPWFCSLGRCPSVIDGMIAFRDIGHVTATYSTALAPQLSARLGMT